jgi:hypothetical protein
VSDLNFIVEKAEAVRYTATPLLSFTLRVTNTDPDEAIHTATLRCQIQIEVARRRYGSCEQESLRDMFGEPGRWSQTLRPMLWTHASTVVPQFSGSVNVLLPVACTFDFIVASTKYFHGVEDGEVPLRLMFSGTVFYSGQDGALQVAPISWDKESRFRLPVAVWKEVMDIHYPNRAWLSLRRDVSTVCTNTKYSVGYPHGKKLWSAC